MKRVLLLVAVVLSLFTLVSCDKDEISVPNHPIEGLWIGTYDIVEAAESGDSFYYSYYIRNDDTLQAQGQGADGNTYYGIGTWNLNDTIFTASLTTTNFGQQGVVQNISAIYDKKKGVLRDGRIEAVGGFFLGSFKLSRIN
jgi:hypothetical protein